MATTLLSEVAPALALALDSLGGKMPKGVEDPYYFYAAWHIYTAVDAFIVLRREHRLDGARLLVRPALETVLRLKAVRVKPYRLYRVRLHEVLEHDKWFDGVARRYGIAYTRLCDDGEWKAFKNRCVAQFGAGKLEDVHSRLTVPPPRLVLKRTTTGITARLLAVHARRTQSCYRYLRRID